ncbi:MAG TPA: type VI secretion system baseplate subunit TssK [Bryobacteraceae bacterium]|nr:type VI secretion system baseplate subunit TssK [Bryobacteraceae bacterium]
MPVLDPVIWGKGTVLNPQHLQLQDRFLADSLWFDLQALNFRPWGFQTIRIDQQALAGGTFVLAEAAGILNDGLLFQVPEADPAPPSRGFAERFGAEQESLDVFLAIPRYREQGLNVANPERRVEARYRAEIEMVRDENTGQSERPVVLARKNFRLLFEGEAQEGNSLMRVARIRKTPAGMFQLDPHFVAPLLDLRASDYLLSIARRLVEILSAKSSELAALRRQKNQSLADFTASDIGNFWLLYTINSSFPVISHIFEGGGCHPEALFSAMLSLAGALTTFSQKIHPRELPAYDHNDLGSCFSDLDAKLMMLLETVVPRNFVSLPLKLVQPNVYATSIDRDEYLKGTRMYLAISAGMNAADLMSRTPHLVKVCAGDYINILVQKALPGVPLIHAAIPPSAIPVKLNYQYFTLSQSGGPWETIVRGRNLAAYVPGDFAEPQLELIILLPQSG